MELHGSPNDSLVLSPIPFSRNKTSQHRPDSEPFTKTPTLKSTASMSAPVSPQSNSTMMFASPSPTPSHGRSLWTAMKQFLTCYNIPCSKNKQKSSKENSVNMMMTSPLPSPDNSYSAMNAEERDENLKAVITYCNKSMKSVILLVLIFLFFFCNHILIYCSISISVFMLFEIFNEFLMQERREDTMFKNCIPGG